jgi:hypothetical protein
MGIRGARSLLDADPARFSEKIRLHWDESTSETDEIIFLVDAMALLYHAVIKSNDMARQAHVSPATVRECVYTYVRKLLTVAGENGAVHCFLDGLAPREKIPTQISRLSQQALHGEILSGGGKLNPKTKLLHLLAEWSFIEAIENLKKCTNRLHLHRASRGEGEAYIDYWIATRSASTSAKLLILSDDSDLLVYPSCPGFIPFDSIRFEENRGTLCFQGRHYLRSKFLKSFLQDPDSVDTEQIMTSVAALAGCDYILENLLEDTLKVARKSIVESNLGGLRQKLRNSPTAKSTLTAILRVLGHHIGRAGDGWIEALSAGWSDQKQRKIRKSFASIRQIYFQSLDVSARASELGLDPSSVDVCRLLQYGVFYCYPVIETWHQTKETKLGEQLDVVGANSQALVTLPPCTSQIEKWMSQNSIWCMPHFRQIRARLYCLIQLVVEQKKLSSEFKCDPLYWRSGFITEVTRLGVGRAIKMLERPITIPDIELVSTGVQPMHLLKDGAYSKEQALFFCLVGNPTQPRKRESSTLFLASLCLPYNLACLLILMGTAPSDLEGINLLAHSSPEASSEVNKVLPLLSVACYHVLLLNNAVSTIFGLLDDLVADDDSSLASHQVFCVSNVIRHDNALMIWQGVRLVGTNLEETAANDRAYRQYLDAVFLHMSRVAPDTTIWAQRLADWKLSVKDLWEAWWEVRKA